MRTKIAVLVFSIAFFADAQITTNVRQMFYFAEQKCVDLTFLEAASNLFYFLSPYEWF